MKKVILGISLFVAAMAAPAVSMAAGQEPAKCNKEGKECVAEKCAQKTECAEGNAECAAKPDCVKKDCKKADCKKAECKKSDCKKDKKACCKQGKGKKGDKHFGHKGSKGKQADFAARQKFLFDGITLDAAQQQKMQALNADVKAKREAAREQMKAEKKKLDDKAKDARMKARGDYDKAVKDILSAEQYAKYEANKAAMKAKHEAKMHARKDGKKGNKHSGRKGGKMHGDKQNS
ncbi:MAG: hypothetical protein K2H35_08360 [Muribaculaceae bacterium]|nr:hypothetical protein [Muribaculaceae bacterium]